MWSPPIAVAQVAGSIPPPASDLSRELGRQLRDRVMHEFVELRRFRREIRRRAHVGALIRLVSVSALIALFVFTFMKDRAEAQRTEGFAPVAAR